MILKHKQSTESYLDLIFKKVIKGLTPQSMGTPDVEIRVTMRHRRLASISVL